MRYNLVDWGLNAATVAASRLQHSISRIEADVVVSEQAFHLLTIGIRLTSLDTLLALREVTTAQIVLQVDTLEARVKAGASRISDLRAIKLLALDNDIEKNRLLSHRGLILEELANEYTLDIEDVQALVAGYLEKRPEELTFLDASKTNRSRALRLQVEAIGHEERQIKGGRWLRIDAVVDGTIFDLADYEDEYEVLGKLEFNMPLYDGGTSRARLREADWWAREMRSTLQNHKRLHDNEMEHGKQRFTDIAREIDEENMRQNELTQRLK